MSEMPAQAWVYRARCSRVVDGDTVDVLLDQGLHTHRIERLRLLGVQAPEMREHPRGQEVKGWVQNWIEHATLDTEGDVRDWPLTVSTYKSDAFGRYLAAIWRRSDGEQLNDALLENGMAKVYQR
jgi:micrococcal nuclease